MDENILEINHLEYSWRKEDPLFFIPHFSLPKGQSLYLAGPSGSGKTTFLHLLGGVIVSSGGDLKVNGCRLRDLSAGKRDLFRGNHIGFIFQMFNLVPYLSVEENILLPGKFSSFRKKQAVLRRGTEAAEVTYLLKALQIEARRETMAQHLSVGQQQRVAVARALYGSPSLIIADEPTSALDEDLKKSFVDLLLNQVKESGASCVFVSHDTTLRDNFDVKKSLLEWKP